MSAFGRSSITDWLSDFDTTRKSRMPSVPDNTLPGNGITNGSQTPWATPSSAIANGLGGTSVPPSNPFDPASTIASGIKGTPAPATAAPAVTPPASPMASPMRAPVAAQSGQQFGSTAKANPDGSYTLPTGEVIPAYAVNTRDINGIQVKVPGYYNPTGTVIMTVNGVGENADAILSRRLKELQAGGYNVNDPNVLFDAMARVRDDSIYALTQRLGRPPTEQELIQATGFQQIGRFVRGSNGGAVASPSAAGAPPASGANPATGGTPAPVAGTPPPAQAPGTPPATGGVPSGTGAQSAVNPITGAKGNSTLADIALLGSDNDSVQARRRLLMRNLGLDPTQQGIFYNTVNKTLGDQLDRYLVLQGIGGTGGQYGNATQNINNFTQSVQSGDYYNQQQQFGRQALQGFLNGGDRNGLDTSSQLGVIGQLIAQQSTGLNPILQQAMASRFQNASGGIADQEIGNLRSGAANQDPVAWLRNSPWADLLR